MSYTRVKESYTRVKESYTRVKEFQYDLSAIET